jgi:hypothetical protein
MSPQRRLSVHCKRDSKAAAKVAALGTALGEVSQIRAGLVIVRTAAGLQPLNDLCVGHWGLAKRLVVQPQLARYI